MFLIRSFDSFLNRTTMYRLLIYSLSIILIGGFVVSYFDMTSFTIINLAISISLLSGACFVTNLMLSRAFEVPANHESSIITTLILACIVQPPETTERMWAVVLVGIIAMASKYLLAINRQHVFNPAAVAVLIVGAAGLLPATWWIATPTLAPIAAVVGACILRKTRHFQLFAVFAIASFLTMTGVGLLNGESIVSTLSLGLTSWPIIFFGTIMLTEPITMPSEKSYQGIYAGLVGVLFASQLSFGPISASPQLALVVGNIFAFAINPRGRFILTLQSKREIAPHIYDFAFALNERDAATKFRYPPGQFLDWTLPHVGFDSRGNRRTFTIASSPTEPVLRLGVKFSDPSSAYKQTLRDMKVGDTIATSRLSGHFVMPRDTKRPLVFIAGGIGITPFRSMAKYSIDTETTRDVSLFHLVNTAADAVYQADFKAAHKVGWAVRYVVREGKLPAHTKGLIGELTPEILRATCKDVTRSIFYISGPPPMVDHYVALLKDMGCKRSQIMTDFFSGY